MMIINKIKEYFGNKSAQKFGKLYNEAVNNLTGGIEYSTLEFKQGVMREMDRIEKNKKSEIKAYIMGGIVGWFIGFGFQLIIDYSKMIF